MTIVEFIKAHGCTCFSVGKTDTAENAITIGGRRLILHAGIDCHTTTMMAHGAGCRPRVARRRRPWLRARRRAMRRTGRPPEHKSTTYVRCRECGAYAQTNDHLEGAF